MICGVGVGGEEGYREPMRYCLSKLLLNNVRSESLCVLVPMHEVWVMRKKEKCQHSPTQKRREG